MKDTEISFLITMVILVVALFSFLAGYSIGRQQSINEVVKDCNEFYSAKIIDNLPQYEDCSESEQCYPDVLIAQHYGD